MNSLLLMAREPRFPEARPSSSPPSFVILNSGKPGSGKSTAFNNLFGLDFSSKCSVFSVTRNPDVRQLLCDDSSSIIVVDTPGLGADDVQMSQVLRNLRSNFHGLDFVLVFCHSVSPGCRIGSADKEMVKSLQSVFGRELWTKCVILLTFSDRLRSELFPQERDRVNYRKHLRKHVSTLSTWLKRECGPHVPDVKLVFDVNHRQPGIISEIVAVPVGQEFQEIKEEDNLLPGLETGSNWNYTAIKEVFRKVNPVFCEEIGSTIWSKMRSTSKSVVATGATVGAVAMLLSPVLLGGAVAAGGILAGGLIGAAAVPVYKAVEDVIGKRNRKRQLEHLLMCDPVDMEEDMQDLVRPILTRRKVKREPRDPNR